MPTRTRATDEARRNWRRLCRSLGEQLRAARLIHGLTQAQVAAALGLSQSEISRRELGLATGISGASLALHAATVGLKLTAQLWPIGAAIRDAGQARYIAAFVARVGARWRVTLEATIPIAGDLRAADILLTNDAVRVVVEVITRLSDLQAQLRAAQAKARDLGATRLVIVVAATHANRDALAATRRTLVDSFDLDSRAVMGALAAGRDPGRDAIVLLTT
jgi:transcriptional regulator with XRE-family HTH domain